MQRDDEGQQLMMLGLAHLLSGWMQRRRGKTEKTISALIRSVHAYLETTESLRLQDTAAHFGYSPELLSRRFHAEMSVTYQQYCEQVRLQRATALLHHGGRSVTQMAERLGYSDESGVIRAFRRAYGITPYAYAKSRLPLEAEKKQTARRRDERALNQ